MSRALPVRHELGRQLGRARTRWLFGLILALPLVFVAAFSIGRSGDPDAAASSFIDLATLSAPNFTVFTLIVSADLLLGIVAAMFLGDSVPTEANWKSLRYLLTAPVPRARLLVAKLAVGAGLTFAAILLLAGWAVAVGAVAYGIEPYRGLTGATLTWPELWPRLLATVVFLFLNVLQVGALAFLLGVRTDAPLAAVGGAIMIVIVAAILNGLDSLGVLRHGLPMHYSGAWLDLFAHEIAWSDLALGVAWSALYAVLFAGLGVRRFLRADVLS
ncbi:MAG: ABC transporter permease subunit [Propionibacteriaceae bacterium]|nr:ABC transporter permease subunit [Propionibacteriaceae bacterium]